MVLVSKGVFSNYNSKNSVVFVFVSVTKNYFQMHKNTNLESVLMGGEVLHSFKNKMHHDKNNLFLKLTDIESQSFSKNMMLWMTQIIWSLLNKVVILSFYPQLCPDGGAVKGACWKWVHVVCLVCVRYWLVTYVKDISDITRACKLALVRGLQNRWMA